MQWNLHITGESDEQDLVEATQTYLEELARLGYSLTSATLTTDSGQTDVPIASPEDVTVEPAAEDDTPPTDDEVETDTPPSL